VARLGQRPRTCGAVYVELGPDPALDQVMECTRPDCRNHEMQLRWVRRSSRRRAGYAELVARLEVGAPRVEQAALL
jgi:hypothetical protein